MAVTQLVLTGMPAFVGAVRGPTKVGFFIDENEFDPKKLIDVDLDKNPATVAPASWATGVDVDYQTTGGWTTIGPSFNGGAYVGGVYLAQRLVTQYASVLANWPRGRRRSGRPGRRSASTTWSCRAWATYRSSGPRSTSARSRRSAT